MNPQKKTNGARDEVDLRLVLLLVVPAVIIAIIILIKVYSVVNALP